MRKLTKPLVGVLLLAGVLLATGCSGAPSEEELKALSDLKSEIASMEGELAKKNRELGDLQKKVADQNGRLQQCQSDQEAVKKAMGGQ